MGRLGRAVDDEIKAMLGKQFEDAVPIPDIQSQMSKMRRGLLKAL